MQPQVLTDKDQFPTEEIIYSHIGNKRELWNLVFDYIRAVHPDFTEEWRYYNDGKSWLFKCSRKQKTIFWLSVVENSFVMTFYLGSKAEKAVINSSIPDTLKEQYLNSKNKIRGITVRFNDLNDVEYAKELIALKLSLK
ncbi:MAG: DUF3788 family protein [Bacillota bacterium]